VFYSVVNQNFLRDISEYVLSKKRQFSIRLCKEFADE
jgi:hypothetical protein